MSLRLMGGFSKGGYVPRFAVNDPRQGRREFVDLPNRAYAMEADGRLVLMVMGKCGSATFADICDASTGDAIFLPEHAGKVYIPGRLPNEGQWEFESSFPRATHTPA